MNPSQEAVFQLATSLQDAWVLRSLIGVLAVGLLAYVLRGLWKQQLSKVFALFAVPAAVFGLVLAWEPVSVITTVASIPYLHRIRFVFGAVSLLVLTTTMGSLKRAYIQERYALLWIISSIVILFMALFPDVLALVRALTGLPYENAMAALVSIALLLVCFHFSLAMSRLSHHLKALTQRLAQLELELELEQTRSRENSAHEGEQP